MTIISNFLLLLLLETAKCNFDWRKKCRMRKSFLVIILCMLAKHINVEAQNTRADSLELIINARKSEDTILVNRLNELAGIIFREQETKAIQYNNRASSISEKTVYPHGTAESLWTKGLIVAFHQSDSIALPYFVNAAKAARESNLNNLQCKYLLHIGITYNRIGRTILSMEYFQKAQNLAELIGDKKLFIRSIGNKCIVYTRLGQYEKAFEGYHNILQISTEMGLTEVQSTVLNNIGTLYQYMGLYTNALEYYYNSLKLKEAEKNKNITSIINTNINIAEAHKLQGYKSKAMGYLSKALTMAEEIHDKRMMAQCYESIGEIHLATNDKLALEYYEKALAITEEMNLIMATIAIRIKMGDYYHSKKDYAKALSHYEKAIENSILINQNRTQCITWQKMGALHLSKNDIVKALNYTFLSLDIAVEMNLLKEQKEAHSQLSEIYLKASDYPKALTHQKMFKNISDSIFNEKNILMAADLEYTYKLEKERQSMELAQQKKDELMNTKLLHQRNILTIAGIALIMMSLLAAILYRLYRSKHQMNEKLEMQKNEIEEKRIQLQQLNAQKDKFFSIISHDLRGSFNSILGFSDLLLTNEALNEPNLIRRYTTMIHDSAQPAYRLLGNLLQWSMSGIGLMGFNPQQLEMTEIAESQKENWNQLAEAKNIKMKINIEMGSKVYADADMLDTILRNLIANAIKYTHPGGEITVTAYNNHSATNISIADNGVGMTQETVNGLFEVNKKPSTPGTQNEKGTGLGLILCNEFIGKHSGSLEVKSQIGKGSKFTVKLPFTN